VRIAVLASGSGTILQSLIDAELPIALVLADRDCAALGRAERAGIATGLVARTTYGAGFDRDAYTHQVIAALAGAHVDLVAMAGFGTILGAAMFAAFPDRVVNTHPALLPAFKGWHAVEDALAAGAAETGCTVHLATAEVDDGPILAQEALAIRADDTVESLHERIKEIERRIYPEVLRRLVDESTPTP
jgi:formyltetrahydrofolate-dependent phosphoribosylglycinamide formyltransferase